LTFLGSATSQKFKRIYWLGQLQASSTESQKSWGNFLSQFEIQNNCNILSKLHFQLSSKWLHKKT